MPHEITITRTIPAPVEKVWKVWTNPEHLIHWWGPDGFTNTFHSHDFRPGGVWIYTMHGPDGVDYPNWMKFEEIVKHKSISYLHGEKEDDPKMFQGTAEFAQDGDRTTVTLCMTFQTAEEREAMVKFGAVEGGNQTLGRLEKYIQQL